MIERWEQGRDVIDRLLEQGRLERIPPNRDLADSYLDQARAHLKTSDRLLSELPAYGS
jgi:hypothetical protein